MFLSTGNTDEVLRKGWFKSIRLMNGIWFVLACFSAYYSLHTASATLKPKGTSMKIKLLVLLSTLTISTAALAGFVGSEITSNITSVQSVQSMSDDSRVTLEGYIVKYMGSEHYLFKDDTGNIEVDIDNEDFNGLDITQNDKIRIIGEVDSGRFTTIDVDRVELVN
ncbi:NirD/YgiW/YdeI family stress tolerance protein [Agarivorans sp. MS3-6]|uniref:NirD/YgiW/YdeI family stress tolerance protein n=1 Tax=Agarivorans sp. TSD2052 TaxID=2937286 RepID=UPI00200F1172|nr:NirD/YgiW/YdeI family stress tolerance protein [Agarivorans sp. TSD2052]UPW17051.1 NirD/YgiW/YdeI family stress tolerance protein [Agarivorans sp. TSD2052]